MKVCLECKRPARDLGQSAADAPGTVQLYGRGLCKPCWRALRNAGTLDTLYPVPRAVDGRPARSLVVSRDQATPCEQCGKLQRPPGTKLEDWPGTIARKGKTCSSCANLRQAGRPFVPTVDVQKMREDLKDWFHSRGRDWTKAGIPA